MKGDQETNVKYTTYHDNLMRHKQLNYRMVVLVVVRYVHGWKDVVLNLVVRVGKSKVR
jgi:hypothetical protein